ncbi:2-dehydro-3-deoxy-6-phosphogalactonate aldolase [Pseudovibrio sp. Ad5]|uniref:2-dehydro-3-deoxy-6-phosphogalactonate aldolase n=1 Tax=Pseudovibrio sp. Ad5 TaxID=989436 RepID=UPI0007AEBBA3|nr:2-dehydro-3-deoxy-6-phosphogalactonate aldolase [Pseudovibrio sp. Ad5]KZL01953.1 2-dehydro-3-deoxy-6-phosphogalactonate aldolase [Pseudovibrio sp. Ad5]
MTTVKQTPERNLMAILRGVKPAEILDIVEVLIEAGFSQIEVPLNSSEALKSITMAQDKFGKLSAIGAGTVLTAEQVKQVRAAGGTFIVSPNYDEDVIRTTKAEGMASYPGVLTPSECFAALKAGADALKIFPAFQVGVKGIQAVRAVLPKETLVYAVGGVGPAEFAQYVEAGCQGFGMASNLYKPGFTATQVSENAKEMVAAYDALKLGESA